MAPVGLRVRAATHACIDLRQHQQKRISANRCCRRLIVLLAGAPLHPSTGKPPTIHRASRRDSNKGLNKTTPHQGRTPPTCPAQHRRAASIAFIAGGILGTPEKFYPRRSLFCRSFCNTTSARTCLSYSPLALPLPTAPTILQQRNLLWLSELDPETDPPWSATNVFPTSGPAILSSSWNLLADFSTFARI